MKKRENAFDQRVFTISYSPVAVEPQRAAPGAPADAFRKKCSAVQAPVGIAAASR